ncbi:hypothetical protein KUV57_12860 [Epibacterium sp. DP7N7-1]|nr:hypothetical protein [Epibacterium sp. DP7N7-1]
MINRRNAILMGASTALLPSFAFSEEFIYTPEVIHKNMQKSIWISTNRSASRSVYVVAAPWCPYCKMLYEAQAQIETDVDFRFIFLDMRHFGPSVVNAFFSDANDQVGLFYQDTSARNLALSASSATWFENVNTTTVYNMATNFSSILEGNSGGSMSAAGFSYPTVIQRQDSGKITGILGAWSSIDEISKNAANSSPNSPIATRYADLIRSAPEMNNHKKNYFASNDNTPIYAAPLIDSPQVGILNKGRGFSMRGTLNYKGEEWLAANAFTSGSAMFWFKKEDLYTR